MNGDNMGALYFIAVVFSVTTAANERITFRKHAFVLAIVLVGVMLSLYLDSGCGFLPQTTSLLQVALAYGAGLLVFRFYRLVASDTLRTNNR